jgi:plasmid maintenance system antidote protein VapI
MTMTEALKTMIQRSGMTWLQLERATGLKRASIMRFCQGKHALRLDLADRLAAYLGIEVKLPKRKGAKRG